MDPKKSEACMRQAVEAAKRSKAEDGRPHPRVGAVLADLDGNLLLEMARGEFEPGDHAEAGLLKKAKANGIDLTETVLFTTLEPCTWRSRKHRPCALRVQEAGIPLIYIGMIDPNLRICGRGETYLSFFTHVERFPANLREEVITLNNDFWAANRNALVWAVKTYGIETPSLTAMRPRQSILHLSQDIILQSSGEICISAGDLSWLKELQPVLLRAHLDGRRVRILCNRPISAGVEAAALGVGAALCHAQTPWPLRATIVGRGTGQTQILIIDEGDTHELGWPEDRKLIETICQAFDERWNGTAKMGKCVVRQLTDKVLIDALRKFVHQYSNARLGFENIPINILLPLPTSLEEFKLARWDLLSRTIERHNLPNSFAVEGSPWPCTPPVVEVYPDKKHVIIDGAHRVYAERNRGKTHVQAIVVRMPNYDAPAIPRAGWGEVSRSHEKIPRRNRYDTFQPEQFRPIRAAFERVLQ